MTMLTDEGGTSVERLQATAGAARSSPGRTVSAADGLEDAGRVVRLRDVAQAAGVSVATASRALNGRTQVRAETRARVLAAAERLEFDQTPPARGLSGRAGTVGVLTSDLKRKSSLRLLLGVENALAAEETAVYLCDARGDVVREKYNAKALLAHRVDGIIVVGSRTDPRPSLGLGLPVPVVYAYAPSEEPHDISIVSDNVDAGAMAVKHLMAQGRTKIAHITGDPTHQAARDRAEGALSALAEAGLPLMGERVLYGRWDESWGRGATRILLEAETAIDAIFAGSDQIARGAVDALQEKGWDVPREIAVIGFDNIELLAANARPQLTSVDMRLEEIGALSARRLFDAMDGNIPSAGGWEVLRSRVVQRGSTAPLG